MTTLKNYSGVIGKFYFRPPTTTAAENLPLLYTSFAPSYKCLEMMPGHEILYQNHCADNSPRQAFLICRKG